MKFMTFTKRDAPKTPQEAKLIRAAETAKFNGAVFQARADSAMACECLASWVDTEVCICGEQKIEVPLDITKIKEASGLVDKIAAIDRKIALLSKFTGGSLGASIQTEEARIHRHSGHFYQTLEIDVPKSLLVEILERQKIEFQDSLIATGLISSPSPALKGKPYA